jgi:FkbM family methyltransferase
MPKKLRAFFASYYTKMGFQNFEAINDAAILMNKTFVGIHALWNEKKLLVSLNTAQTKLFQKKPSMDSFDKFFLTYYDTKSEMFVINGVKLPCPPELAKTPALVTMILADTFGIPIFFNDDHDKKNIDLIEPYMPEGPYGYVDGDFDVTVSKDDIVIDAGAWIGDFSAYAAYKDAVCYAFEPGEPAFTSLVTTASINERIIPVKKGLGEKTRRSSFTDIEYTACNKIIDGGETQSSETITIDITTVDDFVRDNNLPRVDFIKADIEGAERDMLKGARETLAKFAPKLALCTYHLPDDPEMLESLIKEANPAYKIVQRRKKLYAAVM